MIQSLNLEWNIIFQISNIEYIHIFKATSYTRLIEKKIWPVHIHTCIYSTVGNYVSEFELRSLQMMN